MSAFSAARRAHQFENGRTRPASIIVFEAVSLAASVFNILSFAVGIWPENHDEIAHKLSVGTRLVDVTILALVMFPFMAFPYWLSLAISRARSRVAGFLYYVSAFIFSLALVDVIEQQSSIDGMFGGIMFEGFLLMLGVVCLQTPASRVWLGKAVDHESAAAIDAAPKSRSGTPGRHAGDENDAQANPRTLFIAEMLCLTASCLEMLFLLTASLNILSPKIGPSPSPGRVLPLVFAYVIVFASLLPVMGMPYLLALAASRLRSAVAALCLSAYAVILTLLAVAAGVTHGFFTDRALYPAGEGILVAAASFLLYKEFVGRMSAA